jgi:hypothetical protein
MILLNHEVAVKKSISFEVDFLHSKNPNFWHWDNTSLYGPAFRTADKVPVAAAGHCDEDNHPSGWQAAHRSICRRTILFCTSLFNFYELFDLGKQLFCVIRSFRLNVQQRELCNFEYFVYKNIPRLSIWLGMACIVQFDRKNGLHGLDVTKQEIHMFSGNSIKVIYIGSMGSVKNIGKPYLALNFHFILHSSFQHLVKGKFRRRKKSTSQLVRQDLTTKLL